MGNVPEPTVRVTRYEVSCLPGGQVDYAEGDMFTITVEYRGAGRWAVKNRGRILGADGTWSFGYDGPFSDREPITDEEHAALHAGQDAWRDAHRFDEETALRLAREQAPTLQIRGWTVADALARMAASDG